MYEEFYGLSEKPFSIQPDPSFLYWGRGHRLAYAMLEYGVLNHAGISVITGEVGCGKTTLIHRLLDQLSETHTVALLSNIQEGRGELLSWVLMGFGQSYAGKSHVELFSALQEFFIAEYGKGRRVVLVIDEAQNLSVDMLEELRMLSNINAGKDQLLQLILAGQPQLKEMMNRPDMLQLAQRVGSDFHLTPLSREEVHSYIDTRLTIAGAKRRVFSEKAMDLIAEQSRGVPRVINIICDTALVYGFSSQDLVVDDATIKTVIRDKGSYGVFGIASDRGLKIPDHVADDHEPVASYVTDVARSPLPEMHALAGKETSGEQSVAMTASAKPVDFDVAPDSWAQVSGLAFEDLVAAKSKGSNPEISAPLHPPKPSPSSTTPVMKTQQQELPASEPSKAATVGFIIADVKTKSLPVFDPASSQAILVQMINAGSDAKGEVVAGFDVVELKDPNITEGRARNAAYRRLKKKMPDVEFVQFLDRNSSLDPKWIERATRFLQRRPEVVAVEGRDIGANDKTNGANHAQTGEIVATGQSLLIRTDAFEAAGGFRGDIDGLEVADLCIRLRRRGFHVWKLDDEMVSSTLSSNANASWWSRGVSDGARYALGVALHGGPPEYFCLSEQRRAVIWGFAMPLLAILAAGVAALWVSVFNPASSPLLGAVATLGLFAVVYFVKVILSVFGVGTPAAQSWIGSLSSTFRLFPEAYGVLKAWTSSRKAKKS